MTPDRWARIADLFDRAADLPPADRAAFLDAHAVTPDGATDGALREEIERMLAADRPDGYLDTPLDPADGSEPAPPEAGPWRLVERVGQGGMGEVWRAERDAEFDQTAAVKLVRPGLGDALVARFRAERQILAGLDHPSIARLLDGGTASDGRPYLATEFVRGEPVTAWADRRRLGVNDRLALFTEVCEAVAYAHRRLVVHRDLKPSNVLVTDDGRVKLLDFGIAKLLDADVTQTVTARPLLTPAYAAPEQVAGGPVTTATDVYGLGVLLYELLTGTRPHPGGDATRPSDAVTTAGETAGRLPPAPDAPVSEAPPDTPDSGALRSTTADRLRRRLRGDLDRICLKALRAEPDRRYAGAAELAADIQRHLHGLPIEARPESTAYRVGKFVTRNRALVAVAGVALLAVLGGAAVSLWQATEARQERARADDRADEAEEVTAFLVNMIGEARPSGSDGDTLRVRDVLDAGAAQVDTGFADRPLVRAALAEAIANAYEKLGGQTERARSLHEQALGLRRAGLGPDNPLTLRSEDNVGTALLNLRALDELDSLFTAAVDRRRRALGTTHPQTYSALNLLALSANRRPDSLQRARAEGIFHEMIALLDAADPETFVSQLPEESRAEQTTAEVFGGYVSGANYSFAVFLLESGRTEEAVAPFRRAVALGDSSLSTTSSQMLAQGYAVLLRQLERYDEALAIHRRVSAASLALHGPDHAFHAHPLLAEGVTLWLSGDAEGAVPLVEDALQVFGGEDDPDPGFANLDARHYLGRILVDAGEIQRGRAVLTRALPHLVSFFGEDNVRVRVARRILRETR